MNSQGSPILIFTSRCLILIMTALPGTENKHLSVSLSSISLTCYFCFSEHPSDTPQKVHWTTHRNSSLPTTAPCSPSRHHLRPGGQQSCITIHNLSLWPTVITTVRTLTEDSSSHFLAHYLRSLKRHKTSN